MEIYLNIDCGSHIGDDLYTASTLLLVPSNCDYIFTIHRIASSQTFL
jgi:hypothetical protein